MVARATRKAQPNPAEEMQSFAAGEPFDAAAQTQLKEVWSTCDGTKTVMEEVVARYVLRPRLPHLAKTVVLVVAMSPNGKEIFGMADDGHGGQKVDIFLLSDLGYPKTTVEPYEAKLKVWEAYWLAREGKDYLK